MHTCQSPQRSKDIRYFKPVKAASDTGDTFCLLWVGKRQCRRHDERHLAGRLRAVNPRDSLDPAHRSLFERCRLW